jgi:hypothetical protein
VRRPRGPSNNWSSAWLRVVAAFVAFLVAGDHGLASFHQALTEHDVCAEHGDLVHHDSTRHDATRHGAESGIEQGLVGEADHHHCGAVPAAPTRAPIVACSVTIAVSPHALVEALERLESGPTTSDVLAYAPKQSPPV